MPDSIIISGCSRVVAGFQTGISTTCFGPRRSVIGTARSFAALGCKKWCQLLITHIPAFLTTRDCRCTVNCGGTSCNELQAGTFPEAEFDVLAFGYMPWLPDQNIALKQSAF
jgi:hypothetical protein